MFLVIIISLGVFIIYGNKIHQYVFNNSKIEICFYTIVPLSLLTIILGIYTSKGNTLSGNSEYILAHLLACIFGSAIILLSSKFLKLKGWNSFLVFLVPVLFAVGLCILFDQGLSTKCSDNERILILFTGFIRSFFILISFIFMLFAVKSKRMTIKPFFIVLLAITFIDIFSFSRINMNNVCNAFWYKDQLQYPNKLESFYDELTGKYSDPVFDGINFCNNGNMEIWAGNKPADWNLNLVQTERTRGRYKSKSAVSISASHNWSNIYQDVTIPSSKTRKISFGAWVKTIDSKNIRLALGDYQKLVLSVPNSGSNDWEWMEINTMSNPVNGQIKVRPHIMTDNKTNFSVDGVVITMDGIATPFIDQEMDISREEFVKKMNIKTPPKIDLENYRLPQATAFLGIGAKWTYTHIPNVYKIPSLVGVNGFRPKSFLDLYFAFKPKDDPTPGNGGHFEYVSSERFLDLFCFGYDMDEERNILRRDTSLSRFMLYRNFEVVPEGEPTVKRLQNKDFKIWEKLIFNKDLEDFNAHNQKAVKLNYQTRQNDNYLELSVDCGDQPGIVYFSENYDLGWRAAVNGKPVDIRRANHNFMAVVVPSGKNHVVISFIPADFGLRISFVLAGSIFFMVAIFLFWRGNKKLKMAYSYLLIN
ncbi:MAG: YfhO family protein [Desulfobacteraceae bacterium]|nr:YfhO family protein [Desulfobacteraceae bacterium]